MVPISMRWAESICRQAPHDRVDTGVESLDEDQCLLMVVLVHVLGESDLEVRERDSGRSRVVDDQGAQCGTGGEQRQHRDRDDAVNTVAE
ncbi:hypothetical protein [Nocardia sp. NPDC051833]|uniref:hypothetical protein n=1 Tax=Nocardia sp. NPDC051833 TaxID=3155674 RepID=UPI0034453D62